ncbi:MAG: SH3 domain-containing protein [Anaerolineae bacterium]|nr:SH3 domain-containing protein [Anaerolineae bacterium]
MRTGLLLLVLLTFIVPAAAQEDCGLRALLQPDQVGEVRFTDGEPLNVRDSAGRSGSVVGSLDEGTRFNVTGGPVCSGGINWWSIQTETVSGWVAEGADEVYYVRYISPEQLAAESAVPAAPAFDTAAIDPDVRLLMLDNGSRTLVDAAFYPLMTLSANVRIDQFSGDVISGLTGDRSALVLMRSGVDETRLTIPPQMDGRDFIDAQVSPDGTRIAWLYSDCGSNFGCAPDTAYVLSITDASGENRATIWQGVPQDVGRFSIQRWRANGGAVVIEIADAAPYPEPGSPVYSDPGYPPEPDVFEIPLDGSTADNAYMPHAAISSDGLWIIDRNFSDNRLYIYQADGDRSYEIPYPGYWLSGQFTFSPDNTRLVWVDTHYDDRNSQAVALKMLDLASGYYRVFYNVPGGNPFMQGWLSESLLYVRWFDLQWNADYQLVQREIDSLVIDVNTGKLSSLDLPDSQTLLRAVPDMGQPVGKSV